MSFFKKLTEEFKELKANFEDKPKEESKPASTSHEGGYGGGPDHSYQQQQHGYGQGQYPAPPPQHSGPPGQPPLPHGWIAQFDQNSQRWYYVEQATGRTQWDPPQQPHGGYGAPPPPPGGYGGAPHSGYSSPPAPGGYSGERGHGEAGGFYNQ